MFKVRTTAPEPNNPYYYWGVPSQGQCTWGVYGRVKECGFIPCCWYDRETQSGSYTNANEWLENYRDPWVVKDVSYKPVAGDVAVFSGSMGHVAFIERVNGDVALVSDWNRVAPLTYCSSEWNLNESFKGVGELMGFLHFPYEAVETVERDPSVDQIETTDEQLRIRVAPSLEAEIVGHVQLGYYNVLQQTEADGYTWYNIAKDRWCANITTNYLPSDSSDIIKELERYFDAMKSTIGTLTKERDQYKDIVKEVHKITDVGD